MKKYGVLLLLFTFSAFLLKSQQPWQKLSRTGIREILQNFQTPPPEYGMILWWGWDGPMTDAVIKRDLDRIKAMGFRGVMIEAGYGMTAKYLSPEWFELVKIAVNQAKIRGMCVWIEDEGKYPSGFAGGKFSTDRPDLKMQGLVITERFDTKTGEIINRKLPYYTLSAVAFNTTDKTSKILDVSSGELNWQVPEGNWRIIIAGHQFRSSVTRSVNNPSRGKDTTASLFDYLNPLATRQFIEWTHEQYKKYIGDEFGKTMMGFMGDEPDFAYTPWTPGILKEFRTKKGYDVQPYLASFLAPELSEEARRIKADYWDVWSDLFRDNFFKVQADWCAENKIEYIVHLNHEDQLPGLIRSSGDFFKNMRYVGIPGVDAIWSQIWMDHVADYPKLASSAAHLYGRPRAFTESFAAYTYRPSVPQAKWVLDYQLVRGINFVQIMFMSASTSGLPTETAQPNRRTSFFMSDTFPQVAGYVNRATYLLSRGRPASRIGVYFPTSALWYGDTESNTKTLDISRQLTENQLDFDFIDEQALASVLRISKGSLTNLSGQSYTAIIVPSVKIIPKTSLTILREFAASGGKVIFSGDLPLLETGSSTRESATPGDLSWASHVSSAAVSRELLNLLPQPDFKIGKFAPSIKYLHRKIKDAELYFIFNEGNEKISLKALFAGNGNARELNPMDGAVIPLKNAVRGTDSVSCSIDMEPFETKFILISK